LVTSSLRGFGNVNKECFNYFNYTCLLIDNDKNNTKTVDLKKNSSMKLSYDDLHTNNTQEVNCSRIYESKLNNTFNYSNKNNASYLRKVRLHFEEYWGLDVVENSVDWKYWKNLIPSYFNANQTEFYV
jgi:hypothetical protein